jgi:hypothetical protein
VRSWSAAGTSTSTDVRRLRWLIPGACHARWAPDRDDCAKVRHDLGD